MNCRFKQRSDAGQNTLREVDLAQYPDLYQNMLYMKMYRGENSLCDFSVRSGRQNLFDGCK